MPAVCCATFFHNDTQEPDTFRRVLGIIIESARGHSASGKVRVYGEMVNMLCGHNNVDAAAHLEELWNEVIQAHSVPSLCSYSLSMLPPHTAGTLPRTHFKRSFRYLVAGGVNI